MTRLRILLAALFSLMAAPTAWAAEHSTANTHAFTYRNVSGSTLSSGAAVVYSLTDADLTTGTRIAALSNIGYLVTTTTSPDSTLFAGGLMDSTCVDDQECRFARTGAVLAQVACTTDNAEPGNTVGTTTLAGRLGAGTTATAIAGVVLSDDVANTGTDQCHKWVYLNP